MKQIFKVKCFDLLENINYERDVFLVEAEENEVRILCNKMGKYSDSATKNLYTYSPARYEIYNKNGEMYKYYISKKINHINVEDYERLGYVLCLESQINYMKESFENANKDLQINYDKIKVLSINEAYENFNNYMRILNIRYRIYNNNENEKSF